MNPGSCSLRAAHLSVGWSWALDRTVPGGDSCKIKTKKQNWGKFQHEAQRVEEAETVPRLTTSRRWCSNTEADETVKRTPPSFLCPRPSETETCPIESGDRIAEYSHVHHRHVLFLEKSQRWDLFISEVRGDEKDNNQTGSWRRDPENMSHWLNSCCLMPKTPSCDIPPQAGAPPPP